ncbi:PLP-dependent cysteine synthase family protein [Pallidibacillus thermolactis]|jgi:cystathionine beta-synthase (O-acetyl-L-serine)|uniref:PLP-dependent cysteine synthase family protein n=1 Tax=Pallidibacillus thermolactis TaxID=251051 RepID=UPI0021D8F0FF|nr:cysteine synthase family protein [Pallidibacillus thermolactis]MCU9601983.1 cysteine synthase family protein [Pallidibacillus thermolactis subsp. kokeshiiformis]
MAVFENIKQAIGRTPLVKICKHPYKDRVNIYAKLEYLNPGGSVKDRLGKKLLETAIKEKKISPNGTIIEPTAGNTGIGLALAAIHTNINVIFVVPEKFSVEKQILMEALGAKIIHTPTEKGMAGAIEKAKELEKEIPDSYCPLQFENEANPITYYETLAPEIYNDLEGKVDIFVAGAGSGGTFSGCARYFKEKNPTIKTVIVEPEGSILNGGDPGPHDTEGIGMEFLPQFMNKEHFDKIYTIPDKEAFSQVKELARNEGLLVGSSSGCAFAAALKEAEKAPNGSNIIVIFPDGSERYLSQNIYHYNACQNMVD